MAIPAGITAITVTGTYVGSDGTPLSGYLVFTPSVAALDTTDNAIVPMYPTKVTLDVSGSFSVDLVATDDPQWENPGWTYQVTERITGAPKRTYNIELPAASTDPIGITDLEPVSAPQISSQFLAKAGGTMTGDIVGGTNVDVNLASTGKVQIGDVTLSRAAATSLLSNSDVTLGDGTSNRKLVVKANGAADLSALPNGTTAKPGTNGAYLIGSATGGEDDGTGVDTTPHINSYHYQRAQTGSFGESLRHFMMKADAKACIAWWFPSSGYNDTTEDPTGSNWKPQAWVIAHAKANDGLSYHNHLSFEVMSPSNGLTTRLEIPFVDQETWTAGSAYAGVTTTNIQTHDADLSIGASSGVFRVGGGNAYNKDILLSASQQRASTGERWKIRADSTTEAGSNAGTDFSIRSYSDSGVSVGIPLFIKRSTGNIVLGSSSGASDTSAARLTAIWGTSGIHGFYAKPSATPGSGAAYAALMTLSTERYTDLRVSGDANARLVIFADGKHEFGDGTATRDTNLYRSAADKLATDDDFLINAAGKGLRIKEGTNAKMGTATLVGGTVTVSNTSVTATSRIMLTTQSLGTVTAPKTIAVTARTAGTSFTITSADATDTSVVAWHLIEPA